MNHFSSTLWIFFICTHHVTKSFHNYQKPYHSHSQYRLDSVKDELNPVRLSDSGKSVLIGLATVISSYGVYSAVQFTEDEKVITNFKKDAFGKYISSGMKVLEIGFGAGSNLEFYPSGIKLSAIDPYSISNGETDVIQSFMLKYKEKGIDMVSLTRDTCEALPFADNSFDTVVSTLVLCSVENQEQCIDEIIRVLKVGGMFICEEHIYSRNTILGSTQDLFDPAQQALADGCTFIVISNIYRYKVYMVQSRIKYVI
jgi:SAM-dependent methyltransferase